MSDNDSAMLSRGDLRRLRMQRGIVSICSLMTYMIGAFWLRFIRGYRIPRMRQIRRRFRALVAQGHGAVLICANHLTLMDSAVIIWALIPWWRAAISPSLFTWNLPEKRNFFHNIPLRLMCYFGKCIPVIRQGPPEETKRTMEKLKYLLSHGQTLTIFPEGGRTRTGRVDTQNFSYGVGTIFQTVPDVRVLCLYLRGSQQETYSDLPRRGEHFYVDIEMMKPRTEQKSLRGARDIASQIILKLSTMEQKYFAQLPPHRQ